MSAIRVDGKTGLSGAGKAANDSTIYNATEESVPLDQAVQPLVEVPGVVLDELCAVGAFTAGEAEEAAVRILHANSEELYGVKL